MFILVKSTTAKKGGDDCPDCPNPDGGVGVALTTTTKAINLILGNTLTNDQLRYLSTHSEEETEILRFLKQNNTEEGKDTAIEMINSLMSDIPVIFDIETTSYIYQGDPLDFNSLTSEQKVAVVVYALKNAINDETTDFFDLNQLFYNLPSVDVDVVARIPIGGKLLDVRIMFGVYVNLQVKEYPNSADQLGPLSYSIGNYHVNGFWWTIRFRTYGAKYGTGADSLWIAVKEKAQYNYDNSMYFENYLGI